MSGSFVFILRILLATVLYAFLALALYSLWQELKNHGALLAARKIPPLTLSMQLKGSEPRLIHFHHPNVTIGRNPACEFPINEDSISSRHARLSYHHGHWWLEDLGSKNGTFLNNETLLLPTVVVSGDRIRCGETSLVINITGEDQTSHIKDMLNDE